MRLALKMSIKRTLPLLLLIGVAFVIGKATSIGLPAPARALPPPVQEISAAKVCEFSPPGASFSIPHVAQAPELNTDPQSATWAHAAFTWITKDCTHQIDYPELKTE